MGTLAGAITVGSAAPHFVNGLGGLDWHVVVYVTSALTIAGGVVAWLFVPEGPYPFPRGVFDPRQAGLVLRNGLLVDAPTWLLVAAAIVWGLTVVPDSALFSTLVTEHADQAYVGTALALQLAIGFALTIPTIWLVPYWEDAVGWEWAFAFLAPGPAIGIVAMLRLRRLEAS